jgi:hypothetical protein
MAMTLKEYSLGTFDGLWKAAQDGLWGERAGWPPSDGPRCSSLQTGPVGSLFCSTCGEQRRMFLSEIYVGYRSFYNSMRDGGIIRPAELRRVGVHAVFGLRCVQCDAVFTAVMYDGPNGNSLCVLPSAYGGLATPRSPESVRFYCDQASRAASVGAYTAAVAMLRPAVDIVLEIHGYKRKWLGDKLADLEKDINAGTAPPWTKHYNHEFLVVLKKLANDALHSKNAEVPVLAESQDEELYRHSEISIGQLLEVIYERPKREEERLEKLRSAVLPGGQK